MLIHILRSIAFYLAFYGISAILVFCAFISITFSNKIMHTMVRSWTNWHRWCVTHILGITVVVDGELAIGPVLYVIKHESFFEAIDAPTLLPLPSVFAKQELFDIPAWGKAALIYGLIPVARDGGAVALRAMLSEAKKMVADGRPLVIFPEGTRVPHGAIRLCRAVQIAEIARGACRCEQRATVSWSDQAQGCDHLQDWRNGSGGAAPRRGRTAGSRSD